MWNPLTWIVKLFNTVRMRYSDKILKYALPIAESITNADLDLSGGVSEDHPIIREITQTLMGIAQPFVQKTIFGFYFRPDGTLDLDRILAQSPETLVRLVAVAKLVARLLSANEPVPSKGLLETTMQRAYEATHPNKKKVTFVVPNFF